MVRQTYGKTYDIHVGLPTTFNIEKLWKTRQYSTICRDYLEKEVTVNSKYKIALLGRKISPIWRGKRYFFTSQWKRWQTCTNWSLNCSFMQPILRIWPPATTSVRRLEKKCSTEKDLAQMRGSLPKLMIMLNVKKLSSYQSDIGWKNIELCWWIKRDFSKNNFFSLSDQ